jgi:hypothetical protein
MTTRLVVLLLLLLIPRVIASASSPDAGAHSRAEHVLRQTEMFHFELVALV